MQMPEIIVKIAIFVSLFTLSNLMNTLLSEIKTSHKHVYSENINKLKNTQSFTCSLFISVYFRFSNFIQATTPF